MVSLSRKMLSVLEIADFFFFFQQCYLFMSLALYSDHVEGGRSGLGTRLMSGTLESSGRHIEHFFPLSNGVFRVLFQTSWRYPIA